MLDCDVLVKEFNLQSRQYGHFQTNTLGKGFNLLTPLAYLVGTVEYTEYISAKG